MEGGADVRVENLTWRPARRLTPVLRALDLFIPAGQRVLVSGPSGAGKSSLLRAVAGLLLQRPGLGDLTGTVQVGRQAQVPGRGPSQAGRVGLLLQDPFANVVAETVGRDVAFGLENQRVPRTEIWNRVRAALRETRFPYDVDHPTAALSGGEAQRLALAGSLAFASQVMLFDEPTAMLDPVGAEAVRAAVRRDASQRGSTTLIVEHHLEPWLDFADRLVVLGPGGSVVADGAPRDVLRTHGRTLAALGVWVPGWGPPQPVELDAALVGPYAPVTGELMRAEHLTVELHTHERERRGRVAGRVTVALDDVSAELTAGRTLAVSGPSGAGKSTLVSVLGGLMRPTSGDVLAARSLATRRGRQPWRWSSRDLASRMSWVPQLPEHGVVAATVGDELAASGRSCRRDPDWARQRADGLLHSLGLGHLREASPYHLSGGEQRRMMLAAALVHGPVAVLLDEPTVGQDMNTWAAVVGALTSARSAGCGIALASHDALAVDALADDRVVLDHGVMAS